MILISDKALAFCNRPKAGIKIAMGFSEDLGIASDALTSLIKKWQSLEENELEVLRLQEEEIKRDPALLLDHLTAVSLLGGKKALRIRLSNESLAKQFIALVDDIASGQLYPENYLVIEAPELKKKSKLRESFSASPDVVCLQFFAESEAQTFEYIQHRLSEDKVQIDKDALEQFASELPGDRRLANAEIEKLSLYAFEINRSITVDDIKLVCATEQPRGADDAADAALAGNVTEANKSLDRYLEAGGSAISALRTLHFRLLRVIDAQSGARYLRPPVFEKERPAFNKMLRDWDSMRANRALSVLYSAEKACKQAGVSTEAILKIVVDRFSKRQI